MIKLPELIGTVYEEAATLFESPLKVRGWDTAKLDNLGQNQVFLTSLQEKVPSPSDTFGEYEIYIYQADGWIYNVFVGGHHVQALFAYTVENGYFCETRVWQEHTSIGLCRQILFNYYLPKFKGIISDAAHSEMGGKYWVKLVHEALSSGHKVFAVNSRNEKMKAINNESEMAKFSNTVFAKFMIEK